jgi:hypothetical protein
MMRRLYFNNRDMLEDDFKRFKRELRHLGATLHALDFPKGGLIELHPPADPLGLGVDSIEVRVPEANIDQVEQLCRIFNFIPNRYPLNTRDVPVQMGF